MLMLSACGSDSPETPAPAAVKTPSDDELKTWIWDTFHGEYLWASEVPADVDPSALSPAALVEALKVKPRDRYSALSIDTQYNTMTTGQTVGFGVLVDYAATGATIRHVQPESAAGHADLRRGDVIVAIEGKSAADLDASNGWSDAFGPLEAGVVRQLRIQRADQTFDLSLTKSAYRYRTVADARNIAGTQGRQYSYVSLIGFHTHSAEDFRQAFQALTPATSSGVILDFRDNGGGLLDAAALIGNLLAPASASGALLFGSTHNQAYRSRDNRWLITPPVDPLPVATPVVVLTSSRTCSAAEALTAGLQAHRTITILGQTTCGKPVGFESTTLGNMVLNAVTFVLTTASGRTPWYQGLDADCQAPETGITRLGEREEPMLAAAWRYLEDGTCLAPGQPAAGKQHAPAPKQPDSVLVNPMAGLH